MQNVGSNGAEDSTKETKSTDEGQTTLTSSPAMEKDELLAIQQNLTESSPSEDEVSEDELEDAEPVLEAAKFLLPPNMEGMEAAGLRTVDPETQARLEALLEAAGVTGLGKLSTPDGKAFADPEVLRRLTSSVSCALDEAAQALTRMRAEQQGQLIQQGENTNMRSLAEACSDGDIGTVRKLLDEGRSVHETTEEGESLLSLACSAGYYELAQVLLAMRANVEDRGIKGDCTPLMEAASGGHVDIVKLLITQGADVNAQSSAGNTPLHYAACGGYTDVVKVLIEASANVEEHNENGHTPLMEAASAGHVEVAKQLLKAGAGINTHSNEFKESALTLACYKGHLEMVKFLLEAGADQEHKTDEMHTALMEASMDGHVEVARLLLDSGAQVNMPADSFESPLTLAACGGHVELASLLIERGANLEEVNDEGYTPLMEAAREGHEEMVALLLAHGAKINAQTEETQETALTLACCGGFLEVADFLIKAGADIELGCSTPLMEAAQEGHLDLVRYLITLVECGAKVNAQTQTGDTALTYACENGHTDVAEILLQHGAELEHESEGGRTPLMKAARAGHLCSVQFLISKGADVNRQTTTNDHTVLSLACAGGHLSVVELLLNHGADPAHKLKDGSTMLIEAAKGGHTAVVNLLLDWPNTMMSANPEMQMPLDSVVVDLPRVPMQGLNNVVPPNDPDNIPNVKNAFVDTLQSDVNFLNPEVIQQNIQKSLTWHKPKDNIDSQKLEDPSLAEPEPDFGYEYEQGFTESGEPPLDLDIKTNEKCEKLEAFISSMMRKAELLNTTREEQIHKKQQILEELQKVERELQEKAQAQLCQNLQQEEQAPPQPFQLQHLPFPQQFINTTSPTPHFTFGQPVSLPDPGHIIVPGSSPESPQPSCKEFLPPDGEERLSSSDWSGSAGHSPETPPTTTSPSSGPTMGVPIQAREKKKAKRSIKFQQQQQPTQHQLQLNQQSQTTQANTNTTLTNTNGAMEATLPAAAVSTPAPQPGTEPQSAEGVADAPKPPKGPSKKMEQNSRASSEEVDMSNVVPLEAAAATANNAQPESAASPQSSPLQKVSRSAEKKMKLSNDVPVSSSQLTTVGASADASLEAAALAELQNLPLQTMLEQSVAAATSAAATLLDQQYQQLQQERQQLQANYNLQQHVQAELQQLKLQQEYQQLNQQLKVQQALAQQLDLQSKAKEKTAQMNIKQPSLNQAHQLALQQLQVQQKLQQQVVASQALTATTVANVATATTTVTEQAQQYYKLQQDLQQQPQLSLPHIQQQMEQQLQHLHKQLTQQKQSNQQVTQQELLQQAQQLQQQLQQVQQLQELAQQQLGQQQRQLTSFHNNQGGQPPKKSKKKPLVATETLGVPVTSAVQTQPPPPQPPLIGSSATNIAPNNALNYVTAPLNQDTITPPSSTPLTPNPSPASPDASPPIYPALELDAQTETNHDTALTLACAGGHAELVNLLLSRGADIEHRDKKGFTPLILAATAGHADVVEILLDHGADIEAQSERTKDTPLSLACSGGRYEVVELLLARGANKEHRNVSDYTPLSLAASGGYVNIIKLLLTHGAEINSRTGSKLGISPLMLAAMNGHTQAVKLLLDMGSDINAQIETNRNTALTLACFQGRHEVVSLLVDRRANIEHRAKTGLTPLMEAASGGYVEVGRVLLDKGADVNAPPVPSSRDTALTIAADKGHYRFVELLLSRSAAVDVKNKKGNSPLWLACNGGHHDVVQLLVNANADVDSQDNRKVSCLMAAFRKGHEKVVKWLVKYVMQFPSDNECMRFIATCTDKELLKKCHQCMEIIVSAKDQQAAEANKNATILLEELDLEKSRQESKKATLARKRERRRRKKKEKQEKEKEKQEKGEEEKTPSPEPDEKPGQDSAYSRNKRASKEEEEEEEEDDDDDDEEEEEEAAKGPPSATTTSTTGVVLSRVEKQGNTTKNNPQNQPTYSSNNNHVRKKEEQCLSEPASLSLNVAANSNSNKIAKNRRKRADRAVERTEKNSENSSYSSPASIVSPPVQSSSSVHNTGRRKTKETSHSGMNDLDDFGVMPAKVKISPREKDKNQRNSSSKSSKSSSLDMFSVPISPGKAGGNSKSSITSPKRPLKKDEEWKEVTTRKSEFSRTKKVTVPLNAVSRVIGRAGCNINAIREASGAHIEMDKQKGQAERHITIKGSAEGMRQAQMLIMALIKDPDKQLDQLIPKSKQKQSTGTSTSSNTFSSNMWHNSMALGVPASTNTGTIFTAQSCIMSASQRPLSSSRPSSTTVVSVSSMVNGSQGVSNISQVPFANIVRNSCQQPVNGHGPQPPAVASLSNQQPHHSPSPKKSGKVDAASSQNPPNSSQNNQNSMKSNVVVRQLFPESSSSQASATVTKSTVTYSMASMTKSKIVSSTTPTFVVKTEARGPVMASKVQPTSKGAPISTQQAANKHEPQPLPIMSSSGRPVSAPIPSSQTPSSVTAVYSPFNNHFSRVAESVLSKKDESQESRKNFASVAAAGVVSSANQVNQQAVLDALLTKAPGYKPMVSNPNTNHQSEPDLSKAPGYRNNNNHGPAPPGAPNGPLMDQTNFIHRLSVATNDSTGEADPSKAPGYKGNHPMFAMMGDEFSRSQGFKLNQMNQLNMSPRSAPGSSPRSMESGHSPPQLRNEYSTPNHPMTLPKIESTLNPNAPDFTSRSLHQQLYHQHQQRMLSTYQSMLQGNHINPALLQASMGEFPPPGAPGMGSFGGAGMPLTTVAVNSPMPRQASPMAPNNQQQVPPVSITAKDDATAALSSEASPSSSSAPSPTDAMVAPGERRPLPIGSGRSQKKLASSFAVGEPAGGVWSTAFNNQNEWLSSASTSGLATSTVITPSLGGDGEDRGIHPVIVSQLALAGFSHEPTVIDPQLERALQGQAVLLASGAPLPFANGLPAQVSVAASAGLPPQLYSSSMMPAVSGDTPPGWPQHKQHISELGPDPKMWNNWSSPGSM